MSQSATAPRDGCGSCTIRAEVQAILAAGRPLPEMVRAIELAIAPARPARSVELDHHVIEWAQDWQYGVVFRLALADEPHLPDVPPAGDGWVLNTAVAGGVRTVTCPAWSDGSIVLQRTRWRRAAPGARPWLPAARVCENRRPWWRGSTIPARLYEELVPADVAP